MIGLARGASAVIVEALLLLTGISLAVLLSSAVMSRVSAFQNRFTSAFSEVVQSMSERLAYVYSTYNEVEGAFAVYVKNVGSYSVYGVEMSTVFFGTVGSSYYFPYCSAGVFTGCWRFIEFNNANGIVEPAETVVIYIYNSTSVAPPYYFKLITPKGSIVESEFTLIHR